MKRIVITLAALVAIFAGGFIVAQGQPKSGNAPADAKSNAPGGVPIRFGGGPRGDMMLGRLAERLNLTPEQRAKVQPILDQARPQIRQIHEEAMEKVRSVMDGTIGQIRPLLTPEQQAKLDETQQARENMRKAMGKMHDAEGE